jgi:hypothetical protein
MVAPSIDAFAPYADHSCAGGGGGGNTNDDSNKENQ